MKFPHIIAALALMLAGLIAPAATAAEVSGVSSTPVSIIMVRSELTALMRCIGGLDGVPATAENTQSKWDGSATAGWINMAAADYNPATNAGAGIRWLGTVSGVAVTPGTVDAVQLCRLGLEAKAQGYTGGDIPPKP